MIDQLIFGGFLVANLAIGLYYGRNVKTLREYALGTHSFSTLMIAATVVATYTTGSGISIKLKNISNKGIPELLYGIGNVLTLWLVGYLALRTSELKGCLSIAEAISRMYNNAFWLRLLTACTAIATCIFYIGAQLKVGSDIVSLLFNGNKSLSLIIVALIIGIYAAFGGINGVVYTDLFQSMLIGIFIPLLIFVVYVSIDPSASITSTLASCKQLSFKAFLQNTDQLATHISKLSHVLLVGFLPHLFQRVLLARKVLQAQKAFFVAGWLFLLTIGAYACLSFLLLVANTKPQSSGNFLAIIIKKYGTTGLKGFMVVGLCAMVMSTADSYLNTASVLLVNDVLKPISKKQVKKNELTQLRYFSLLLALAACMIASTDIGLEKLVHKYGKGCYMPIAAVPLLLALIGFRSSERIMITGGLVGALVSLFFGEYFKPLLGDQLCHGVLPGVIVNLITVFTLHYFLKEPGGWIGIKVKTPLIAARQKRARNWQNFKDKLAGFNLYNYINRQLPKNETIYGFWGLYILGPVFFSFFLLKGKLAIDHSLFHWMAYPMLVLNTLLLTYPSWLSTLLPQSFITYFFPCIISFSLFGVPSTLWITSSYHPIFLVLLGINLSLVLLQFYWFLTVCTALFGMLVGYLLLQWTGHGVLSLTVTASSFMMITYAALLFSCFCIALLRHIMAKNRIASYYYQLVDEHNATTKTLRKLRTTPERFAQQLRDKVTGLETAVDMSKALGETFRKPKDKQDAKVLTQAFDQLTRHIQDSSRYLNKLFALVEQGGLLRNKNIALDSFTHKLLNARARDPELHTSLITANQSKAKTVNWDSEKIQDLLIKGHRRLQKAHPDQDYFFLHMQDTRLAYPNYPKGLPAVALTLTIEETAPQVEPTYLPPDSILTIASTPYQRQAQQGVSTHYGFFGAQQAPQSYLFVLPKILKAIRPSSISDTPTKSFSPAMLRKAKVMEAEFWMNIGKKAYDIPVIEKAVAFMKDAHGHQQRKSGEPYYTHPLTVAQYVSQHNKKQDVLIAALLHDTLEDTDVTPEALKLHFSPRVSELVQHLSHIENTFKKYKLSDDQTHSKLEKASHDKEAVLIKLCDRLHNLRTLGAMPKHKQLAKAKETLKVYIPLGKKVGYTKLAKELTRLCEAVLG